MSSNKSKQRFDEDILRCKAEILRLKGLVPPLGKPPKQSDKSPADKPQSPEIVSKIAPLPVQEKSPDTTIISVPTDNDAKPAEAPDELSAEPPIISASDRLYEELQKPMPDIETENDVETALPEMEADRPYEKAVDTELTEESPVAEVSGDDAEQMTPSINETKLPSEPAEDLEIPAFDLAQQIMAEQRKIIGNRRKRPDSSRFEIKEEESEPINNHHLPPTAVPPAAPIRITAMEAPMSPQQRVVAEIVARDIRKFYPQRTQPRMAVPH